MAVYGIEIKAGQIWERTDGDVAYIVSTSGIGLANAFAEAISIVSGLRSLYSASGELIQGKSQPRLSKLLVADIFNPFSTVESTAVLARALDKVVDQVKSDKDYSAPAILDKARQHMLDRAATYDQQGGERSMGKTVKAFNAITGRDLSEPEGWLLLQLLKDVRLFTNPSKPHIDSIEDAVAYAALKGESFLTGK